MNAKQNALPRAGDAVILTGDYAGAVPGDIGVIGGSFRGGNNDLTFNYRAFRTEMYVSCGGGPGLFNVPDLHPTGLTTKVTFWRWKNGMAGAGNGEEFALEVPLWEYKGEGPALYWKPEEVTVERLLADKKLSLTTEREFWFPEEYAWGDVYRGGFCVTRCGNRPSDDYMGRILKNAYLKRKLLTVLCHIVPQGVGYMFTVQLNGGAFTAFRTRLELDEWMQAYALEVVAEENHLGLDTLVVVPNAKVESWQPLRHEAIAVD